MAARLKLSSPPPKPSPFNDVRYRFPLAPEDRLNVKNPTTANTLAGWPDDALIISGKWKEATPLQIRPILPGEMTFFLAPGQLLPDFKSIDLDDDKELAKLVFEGMLRVEVKGDAQKKQLQASGVLEALGVAPTCAFYGPLRLTGPFYRTALLDPDGLLPGELTRTVRGKNRDVLVTDPNWRRLAIERFIKGTYKPFLRTWPTLRLDDAGRCDMPVAVAAADGSFSFGVALGWSRTKRTTPADPADANTFEPTPTVPFLRHVGTLLREKQGNADALFVEVMNNEDTSKQWNDRFLASLRELGFGSLTADLPVEQVVREFQICAKAPVVAEASNPAQTPAQLALRDFSDLVSVANRHRYTGPVSGRANLETRKLIDAWAQSSQRCPVVMPAWATKDLDASDTPKAGTIATHNDVWARREPPSETKQPRIPPARPKFIVFCADFTQTNPGTTLSAGDLVRVGYNKHFGGKPSGAVAIWPDTRRSMPTAEVTPKNLFNGKEAELIRQRAEPPIAANILASSFKVVRAVAEQECIGYLDQLNGYDDAGISIGLFHSSLALAKRNPTGSTPLGGLAAYLDYLRYAGRITTDFLKPQGLAVFPEQDKTKAAHSQSSGSHQQPLGYVDDLGAARAMTKAGVLELIPSWRSVWRWMNIERHDKEFANASWNMALRRLKLILKAKMGVNPKDDRQTGAPTIGSVFTTELLIAFLYRWHVKVPAGVCKGDKASKWIDSTYAIAAKNQEKSGKGWEEELETALFLQLDEFVALPEYASNTELHDQFIQIKSPAWVDLNADPPVVRDPSLGYRLDPLLRKLSPTDKFLLQPPDADP